MLNRRCLSDFQLAHGDGREHPFQDFLADFNILAFRRVPVPSHGPPTKLLRRFLAKYRGAEDATVRAFDIRSPDEPCEACESPHVVFMESELATICDGDGSIFRRFGVVGEDRLFVVRTVPQITDVGFIEDIVCWSTHAWDPAVPAACVARAPPEPLHAGQRDTAASCLCCPG